MHLYKMFGCRATYCDHNPFPTDDYNLQDRMAMRYFDLFLKNYELSKEYALKNDM